MTKETEVNLKKINKWKRTANHQQRNKKQCSTFDQCFHTKDVNFHYCWLTPMTIPMMNDNWAQLRRIQMNIGMWNAISE